MAFMKIKPAFKDYIWGEFVAGSGIIGAALLWKDN